MADLKPCPFCGMPPSGHDVDRGMVRCVPCGVPFLPIAIWNRRAQDVRGGAMKYARMEKLAADVQSLARGFVFGVTQCEILLAAAAAIRAAAGEPPKEPNPT